MNIDSLKFQINELRMHAENCLSDLESGKIGPDDDAALSVDLGHILDHICWAWHYRDVAPENFGAIPGDEFSELSNTVPNFGCTRKLGDTA